MTIWIIVRTLANPDLYQLESVTGHIPPNYVCLAPESETERDAIRDDLRNGSQDLISQWVNENT